MSAENYILKKKGKYLVVLLLSVNHNIFSNPLPIIYELILLREIAMATEYFHNNSLSKNPTCKDFSQLFLTRYNEDFSLNTLQRISKILF